MIQKVARSMVLGHNLFNPKTAQNGFWYNKKFIDNDYFMHSDFIPVQPGDIITFGPAVITQGYHVLPYSKDGHYYDQASIHTGLTVGQTIEDNTCIMQYRVKLAATHIRIICETRYVNQFWVTKNREFTADDYRSLMKSTPQATVQSRHDKTDNGWTVIVNTLGRGQMTVGNHKFEFEPGMIVCIPPGTPYQKTADEGFSDLYIISDQCVFDHFPGNYPVVLQDDQSHSIEALVQLMYKLFWAGGQNEALLEQLYNTVEQILVYRMEKVQPIHQQIHHIINTMRSGFSSPDFSLEEIFAEENYSSSHLHRVFKQKMGCTPMDYLMQLRLNHAKTLLKSKENISLTVFQIAHLSGFSDHCYFSRVFKKKVGIAPGKYRNEHDK